MDWLIQLAQTSPQTLILLIVLIAALCIFGGVQIGTINARRIADRERIEAQREADNDSATNKTVLSLVELMGKLVGKLDKLTDEWSKANERQEQSNILEEKRIAMRREIALSNDQTINELGASVTAMTTKIAEQIAAITLTGDKLGKGIMDATERVLKQIAEQMNEINQRFIPIQEQLAADSEKLTTVQGLLKDLRDNVPSDLDLRIENLQKSVTAITDSLVAVTSTLTDIQKQTKPADPDPTLRIPALADKQDELKANLSDPTKPDQPKAEAQ